MKKSIIIAAIVLLIIGCLPKGEIKSFHGGNIVIDDTGKSLYYSINTDASAMGIFYRVDGKYSYDELVDHYHPSWVGWEIQRDFGKCISAIHEMIHPNSHDPEIDVPETLKHCREKYGFEPCGVTYDFELIRKLINNAYGDETAVKTAKDIRKEWGTDK